MLCFLVELISSRARILSSSSILFSRLMDSCSYSINWFAVNDGGADGAGAVDEELIWVSGSDGIEGGTCWTGCFYFSFI